MQFGDYSKYLDYQAQIDLTSLGFAALLTFALGFILSKVNVLWVKLSVVRIILFIMGLIVSLALFGITYLQLYKWLTYKWSGVIFVSIIPPLVVRFLPLAIFIFCWLVFGRRRIHAAS